MTSCAPAVPMVKLTLSQNMTTDFTVSLHLQDQADDVMLSVQVHHTNSCQILESQGFYKLCTESDYGETETVKYYNCTTTISDNQPVRDLLITLSPRNVVGLCEVAIVP